ncbi:hypothetical protein PROFUN_06844 [Planoprotostelium fungivorum]|uniref:DUF1746 domain-containing protein n=1 Tax=Planoprotostelium fungivorum TaxID=1890364 RepID=A0A2P6NND9_9EUKA|nr:hypothetical protein PROFUN_06844 [Planoprotostelium fungivorum]
MQGRLNEQERKQALSSLLFILSCNVIYVYFLDWNFTTLVIRSVQLFCVYQVRPLDDFTRNLFMFVVMVSNVPVLLIHCIVEGTQPLILMFVGQIVLSRVFTLLFNDLIIIGLQTIILLHPKFLTA